jgi:hypothetical protein
MMMYGAERNAIKCDLFGRNVSAHGIYGWQTCGGGVNANRQTQTVALMNNI